jgi:hypothetical protein
VTSVSVAHKRQGDVTADVRKVCANLRSHPKLAFAQTMLIGRIEQLRNEKRRPVPGLET